jgi:hypothetical protein
MQATSKVKFGPAAPLATEEIELHEAAIVYYASYVPTYTIHRSS